MNQLNETEIAVVAEEHRHYLPDDFFSYCDRAERSLKTNKWPPTVKTRGAKEDEDAQKILHLVLDELRILLCTDEKRYAEVREKGRDISKMAVTSIATYMVATFGFAIGMTTGAVGFGALLVCRVGSNVFCRAAAQRFKEC